MAEPPLQALAVIGSLHRDSVIRIALNHVARRLQADGCVVDVLDLQTEPLPLYNPDSSYDTPEFEAMPVRRP